MSTSMFLRNNFVLESRRFALGFLFLVTFKNLLAENMVGIARLSDGAGNVTFNVKGFIPKTTALADMGGEGGTGSLK